MPTIEQRLERLERSQKRYRFAMIGLLCLMVAGVSMGQADELYDPGPLIPSLLKGFDNKDFQGFSERTSNQISTKQSFNVIRATELQIVTPTGQVVGVFGQDGTRGGLSILNRFGTPLLAVIEDADGQGAVAVANKEGKRVGWVGASSTGQGYLSIADKDQKVVGVLRATDTGQGFLNIYNQDEKPVGWFGADTEGQGYFSIANKEEKQVGWFSVTASGDARVVTTDRNGKATWNSTQSLSTGVVGDLDNDNDVDFSDFLLFAQNFGKNTN